MCAIVDANKFGDFMNRNLSEDARLFREWVEEKDGGLVYPEAEPLEGMPKPAVGDMRRLVSEYRRSPNMLFLLEQYHLKGLARRVKLSKVAGQHPETAKARSDDRHILALALASGARLLYTADKKLARDFQNPEIIGNPPGEVYASAADEGRLRPDICNNC